MINTKPRPPLGAYPHDLLYGQLGIAPISSNITMINKIVPKVMSRLQ